MLDVGDLQGIPTFKKLLVYMVVQAVEQSGQRPERGHEKRLKKKKKWLLQTIHTQILVRNLPQHTTI